MKSLLMILSLAVAGQCVAGSQQPTEPKFSPEAIATFSKDVEHFAASQGARAFIIARRGRPEADLPEGVRFTHTAIAVYSSIELSNGEIVKGYAIHNLYQDAQDQDVSHLITDYPVDFFWGAYALEAGIIIPTVELQSELIALYSEDKAKTLHNPNYSVIANPFNSQRQNCTEYTLDLVNAAVYSTTDIGRIKANVNAYFKPEELKVSRAKLTLGSMFSEGITLKDHNRKVVTATFGSISDFMDTYDLSTTTVVFRGVDDIKTI